MSHLITDGYTITAAYDTVVTWFHDFLQKIISKNCSLKFLILLYYMCSNRLDFSCFLLFYRTTYMYCSRCGVATQQFTVKFENLLGSISTKCNEIFHFSVLVTSQS